jgi:hypothetical protein
LVGSLQHLAIFNSWAAAPKSAGTARHKIHFYREKIKKPRPDELTGAGGER